MFQHTKQLQASFLSTHWQCQCCSYYKKKVHLLIIVALIHCGEELNIAHKIVLIVTPCSPHSNKVPRHTECFYW